MWKMTAETPAPEHIHQRRNGDPTANVIDLVEAAVKRLDDLRDAERNHIREVLNLRAEQREHDTRNVREIAVLRAVHDKELREAEAARIDAIRAVDVGAVNRAAEVATTQATTLATQVQVSAETLRTQVATAASQATVALAAALEPIQKDIADLRRAQYEAQGVKTQTGETRLNFGAILGGLSVLLVLLFGIASVVIALTIGP